jgi:hypothetical protein
MYCNGFYSLKNSINFPQKLIINEELFTIVPKTKLDKITSIDFALIKLIEANLDLSLLDKSFVYRSNELSKNLVKELYNVKSKFVKSDFKLVKRYELMYNYSLDIYKYLYNSSHKISTDFFYKLGCALYFSIESYYSICTVNVVVLKLQGKKDIKLDNINYLCSVIENLGDFNKHYQEILHQKSKKIYTEKNILLILSKYIYRIYYSLQALEKIDYNLEEIEHLIQKRNVENVDIEKLNFKCIGCETDIEIYIKSLNKKILERIQFHLSRI